jgi:hypothetical protein
MEVVDAAYRSAEILRDSHTREGRIEDSIRQTYVLRAMRGIKIQVEDER